MLGAAKAAIRMEKDAAQFLSGALAGVRRILMAKVVIMRAGVYVVSLLYLNLLSPVCLCLDFQLA